MIVTPCAFDRPVLDESASQGLAKHFGLTAFRPGQAEVIASVLSGRNTVVVMPTGAGKSLCFQLPAMLLDGVTVVVSPLIALMKDQVEALNAKGIAATFINSTLSEQQRSLRQQQLRMGAFKLIYVAPERFRSEAFTQSLAQANVALYAIDEAHCISQWGHDFRPDYALLGQVRKRLRPPRTVALTATATPEVREDIVRMLLMKDPQVFVAGFDRPNLFLEVAPVAGDVDKRAAIDEVAREGSGLIYCSTRKQAEAMHHHLKTSRRPVVLYHAGLDDEARKRAQEKFMAAPGAIAVATNAFGMGIDKPDIRFVAHAGIPRAVEAYYQEIGRAGRDGRPSRAVLLFNHADVFTQERLISSNHPPVTVFADVWEALRHHERVERDAQRLAEQVGATEFQVSAVLKFFEKEGLISRSERAFSAVGSSVLRGGRWAELGVDFKRLREQEKSQRLLLKRMTDYAYNKRCRRSFLLRYFGEAVPFAQACGTCDVCSPRGLSLTRETKRAPKATFRHRRPAPRHR